MIIRTPDLRRTDDRGIPLDFLASMELFNRLLSQKQLPHCPRTFPITIEEIQKFWMPSAKDTLTYLGFEQAKLLASGTLLQTPQQNAYSQESGRQAEYALIFQPGFQELARALTVEVLSEANQRGLTFMLHTSIQNSDEIGIMRDLGRNDFRRLISNYERYAQSKNPILASNPLVYEYIIPPEKIKKN